MSDLIRSQDLRVLSSTHGALTKPISFQLSAGELLLIRGDNGSGKSTLLKTLLGLHGHFKGSYSVNVLSNKIEYVPQIGSLDFHLPLTLEDILMAEKKITHPLIDNLDLKKKWNSASGGERQRVLLAKAFYGHPQLLILDEPFNHVDQRTTLDLEAALLQFLNDNPQSAVILVSHRELLNPSFKAKTLEL